jgi:hypothetical protein
VLLYWWCSNTGPCESQKTVNINFSYCWLRFELFLTREYWVFSIPYSGVWFPARAGGYTCHHQWQCNSKRRNLSHDTSSKGGYKCLKRLCVCCSTSWLGTHLAQTFQKRSLVGDFIDITVANLQLVCHFSSHPPVVKNQHADLFSVPFSSWCG